MLRRPFAFDFSPRSGLSAQGSSRASISVVTTISFNLQRSMFPLSVAICWWVSAFLPNCCAYPGDSCYPCEYCFVGFGLDQNMARSVCPWTLFGHHPTVNMDTLNCWKDIRTTNLPQSRWVWCVVYCSTPNSIVIRWRTPLFTTSKAKLSTTAASFNEMTEISIWDALMSTCLPWTWTPPSWWSGPNDPHWMRLQKMLSLSCPSSDD